MSLSIKKVVGTTAVLAGAIAALYHQIPLDSAIQRVAQENLIALDKAQVLGAPFVSSYLKNGTWSSLIRMIGDRWGKKGDEFPGIIRRAKDCSFGLCMDYVSSKTGTSATLNPENLIAQGYEIVPTPQKNDVVIYFNSESNHWFEHIGLVSAVENDAVWVESKWGELSCYEHLEEAVPQVYGNAVIYLRKK